MEDLRESFENLKVIIAETETDFNKFMSGNKAAGTRVRKAMMDLKNNAQEIRVGIQELKKAEN